MYVFVRVCVCVFFSLLALFEVVRLCFALVLYPVFIIDAHVCAHLGKMSLDSLRRSCVKFASLLMDNPTVSSFYGTVSQVPAG